MFIVPKQHLKVLKPRQKQHVVENWFNKDTSKNTWETRRILGPKSTQRE